MGSPDNHPLSWSLSIITRTIPLIFILSCTATATNHYQTFEEIATSFRNSHVYGMPKPVTHQQDTSTTKTVLNLLNAALVSKKLSELPSPPKWHETQAGIQARIKSLEHNNLPLHDFLSTERSRLEDELTQQPISKIAENLFRQMATLRSVTKSTTLVPTSTASKSDQLNAKSQLVTLSLLQAYVCFARFTTPLDDHNATSQTIRLSPDCGEAFTQVHSELTKYPAYFIKTELPDKHAQILHEPFHAFRDNPLNSSTSAAPITVQQVYSFLNAAADMDSATDRFIASLNLNSTQLHTSHNRRNWRLFAVFHQIPQLTYADAAAMKNTLEYGKTLRILRARVYSAVKRTSEEKDFKDFPEQFKRFDEQVVGETLHEIQSGAVTTGTYTNCRAANALHHKINPAEFESYLAKLNFYQQWRQLFTMMNLGANKPHAAITDANLNLLITLSVQVIRSSLLKIEYKRAITRLDTNSLAAAAPLKYDNPTSRLKEYTLVLTESTTCDPDNFLQPCYLVNGQYPGPPIIVNQHDFLRVTVINQMSVSTTMHFHGILQRHTVSSDGVSFVTQYPILPNQSYVYEMYIGEQTGTYMYHGHMHLDLIWLHGPLIVMDNPAEWQSLGPQYAYDKEHTFMLEEIFHEPFEQIIDGIIKEGIDDPLVTSFAINGKSYGEWNKTKNGKAPGYEVKTVTPGKTYRFRVINMAGGSMLLFTIDNHNMTIIEMDGITVNPVVTDRLELHTGQRYSVLVRMDRHPSNYWVRARLMGEDGGADNGRAIIHYECADDPTNMTTQVFSKPSDAVAITSDTWILDDLMPQSEHKQAGVYDFPVKSDRQILVDMQMRTTEGPPRYLINGHLVDHNRNHTLLEKVRVGGDIIKNDTHVFPMKEGEVIDIVFQNRVDDTGGCDEHPIHFHGHFFWLAASGADQVDMSALESVITPGNNRQFRDTITLFPNSTVESEVSGTPCGWAVVRLVADNPGVWLVHCHVTSHMMLGKRFYLYEYNENNPKLTNE